jgi:hypothetical protein
MRAENANDRQGNPSRFRKPPHITASPKSDGGNHAGEHPGNAQSAAIIIAARLAVNMQGPDLKEGKIAQNPIVPIEGLGSRRFFVKLGSCEKMNGRGVG